MSNHVSLKPGEKVIVYEKCKFQHSKTNSILGELVLTQDGVVFIKTSGLFKTSRERLHSYEYRHIKSRARRVQSYGLTLKVDTAQNVVTFKYRMNKKRAEQLARIIGNEMRRVRREEEKREEKERKIREEKVKAEKREREQEQQRRDEKRRKDQLTSSIMIVDESVLPVFKKTSTTVDVVTQKNTDLMVGEFDFLRFEARQGNSVLIEFSALETDELGFDIYLFLDTSPEIASTLSGGISGFTTIEALWSEKEVSESTLMGCRVLNDLKFCVVIHKRGHSKKQDRSHFSVQVKTWSEAKGASSS